MLLEVSNLRVSYGCVEVLKEVSLGMEEASITCIVGTNGAGKSTLLSTISGLKVPTGGKVVYKNEDITGMAPQNIVKKGIVQVPEGRGLFPDMTVLENLELGAYLRRDSKGVKRDMENVYTLFPRLQERKQQRAGSLSGGEQQMLAIGRALMASPRLLLLDEPFIGLAPLIIQHICGTIQEINKTGVGVLVVEQNARVAMKLANWCHVMELGKLAMSGDSAEMMGNEYVKKAYLGE